MKIALMLAIMLAGIALLAAVAVPAAAQPYAANGNYVSGAGGLPAPGQAGLGLGCPGCPGCPGGPSVKPGSPGCY